MKKNKFILLVGVLLTLFAVSCIEENEPYKPPTLEEEMALLNTYLDTLEANGRNVDTTAQGNYYIILDEGEGDLAQDGDTLKVGYAGYFIDGQLFDASQYNGSIDGTYQLILGETSMIDGWNDGMYVMNKGAKIQLIVPSENAYGSTGYLSIPPFTTLIFIIQMVDLKPRIQE